MGTGLRDINGTGDILGASWGNLGTQVGIGLRDINGTGGTGVRDINGTGGTGVWDIDGTGGRSHRHDTASMRSSTLLSNLTSVGFWTCPIDSWSTSIGSGPSLTMPLRSL